MVGFLHGCWASNSGPCNYTASSLMTELSPQAHPGPFVCGPVLCFPHLWNRAGVDVSSFQTVNIQVCEEYKDKHMHCYYLTCLSSLLACARWFWPGTSQWLAVKPCLLLNDPSSLCATWGGDQGLMSCLLSFFTFLSEMESLTNPGSQWFSQAGWLVSPIYLAIASAFLCLWKHDTLCGLSQRLLRLTVEWNSRLLGRLYLASELPSSCLKGVIPVSHPWIRQCLLPPTPFSIALLPPGRMWIVVIGVCCWFELASPVLWVFMPHLPGNLLSSLHWLQSFFSPKSWT